jgi:hypothetical protein
VRQLGTRFRDFDFDFLPEEVRLAALDAGFLAAVAGFLGVVAGFWAGAGAFFAGCFFAGVAGSAGGLEGVF